MLSEGISKISKKNTTLPQNHTHPNCKVATSDLFVPIFHPETKLKPTKFWKPGGMVIIWHQPKTMHCEGEIPQIYHTFATLIPPNGQFNHGIFFNEESPCDFFTWCPATEVEKLPLHECGSPSGGTDVAPGEIVFGITRKLGNITAMLNLSFWDSIRNKLCGANHFWRKDNQGENGGCACCPKQLTCDNSTSSSNKVPLDRKVWGNSTDYPSENASIFIKFSLVFFSVFEEMFRIFSIESYLLVWNIPSNVHQKKSSHFGAFVQKCCVSSSHLVILLRGGGNHSFAGDNSSWCTWWPCISCLRCMLSAHHRERPAKLEAAVGQRKRDESLLTWK